MEFLRLNSNTSEPRHDVLFRINEAFLKCGGGFTDFHMFSNNSFTVNFVLPGKGLSRFCQLATKAGLRFTDESNPLIEQCEAAHQRVAASDAENELHGTLQICFQHHDADLRIEVPPIPG
jgi:hypothetical protein